MSKKIIEQALQQAINYGNLHIPGIQGGSEDVYTKLSGAYIFHCFPQVGVVNLFNQNKIIDIITYNNAQRDSILWTLEAKHYTPHQCSTLDSYLKYSLNGPIKDVLKQIDCGFSKFYILQLQTHITDFHLIGGASYEQLYHVFPLFRKYLSGANTVAAHANINRAVVQDRIVELENYSRLKLDSSLICGHIPKTINIPIAEIDVNVHYLISGPFYSSTLLPRIGGQLGPHTGPYEPMIGGKHGQTPSWEIDVSIDSDPEG